MINEGAITEVVKKHIFGSLMLQCVSYVTVCFFFCVCDCSLGQFYCTPCAKHFSDDQALTAHYKAKAHKRRLKDVAQVKYTQEEAERAAGKTKEILPPVRR